MSGFHEILVILAVLLAILFIPRLTAKKNESPMKRAGSDRPRFQITGKIRLFIVLSIIWPLLAAAYFEPWKKPFTPFFFLGIFPVLLIWGLKWIAEGFKKNRK